MSKRTGKELKDIVPPPEMCQKIPDYFPKTALVWERYGDDWYVNAREFNATDWDEQCPAPTLEEIFEDILDNIGCTVDWIELDPHHRVQDALQTWFNVTGALDEEN